MYIFSDHIFVSYTIASNCRVINSNVVMNWLVTEFL